MGGIIGIMWKVEIFLQIYVGGSKQNDIDEI